MSTSRLENRILYGSLQGLASADIKKLQHEGAKFWVTFKVSRRKEVVERTGS